MPCGNGCLPDFPVSLCVYINACPSESKKCFEVMCVGEKGSDEGGVREKLLKLLFKQVCKTSS